MTSYQWIISRNGTQTYTSAFAVPGFGQVQASQKGFIVKMGVVYTNYYNSTTTELLTDIVVSQTAGTLADQFAGVYTDNPTELPKGYNSNHMSKKLPNGGNILFMDQHVQWRRFQEMKAWVEWPGSTARWNWF